VAQRKEPASASEIRKDLKPKPARLKRPAR
jgi:hypothetical protein